MHKKHNFPLIILIVILGIGILYWQKQAEKQETQNDSKTGSVAGININNPNLKDTDADPNLGSNIQQDEISDGKTYQYRMNEIRKPINDAMYDLIDRIKYQKKYTKEDIAESSKNARQKTDSGKTQLEKLNINAKFSAVNKKAIQSIQYLIDATIAVDKLLETGEAKYLDEFNLNIDYSNREVNNLAIPN